MKSVFFIIHTMAWLLLFVSTTQANEQSAYQNSLNQDSSNPNTSNLSASDPSNDLGSNQANNLSSQANGLASGQTNNETGYIQNDQQTNNISNAHSDEHSDGKAEAHDFPPAVEAFHDVMAPLWHAPAGEQRVQEICVQSSQLVANVGIIQQSETPTDVKADKWNQAVTNLTQAVTELEQQCDDKQSPEPALGEVHEAFHHLVKLLEHKQATPAMNTGANSGVTSGISSGLNSDTKSDLNSGIAPGAGAGTKAITTPADDETDYEKVSDAFAECSALQNTLASLISNNQQEFENHTLHHAANDALIVASDFAQAGGLDEDIVKTQYDFHYTKFQDMLNASTTDNELFAAEAKPIIDKCASLNDIQTQLISERQKQNEQPEEFAPAEY